MNPRGTPENLRPFARGRSGNPRGRPRGRSTRALLCALLERPVGDGRAVADVIAETIVERATAGDLAFIRTLLDRVEGRPGTARPGPDPAEARDAWRAIADELVASAVEEQRDLSQNQ